MDRPSRVAALALGSAMLAGACATPSYHLPAITTSETGISRTGEFVWIDLVTDDVEAARQFYGELFDWQFREEGEILSVTSEGRRIAGIARRDADDADEAGRSEAGATGSAWISSLSVPDIDEAASRVKSSGGRIEIGPTDVGARGRAALVSDPGGAHFLLLSTRDGDPEPRTPAVGEWLWRELWTLDADEAIAFYEQLGGFEAVRSDFRDTTYFVLERGGEPRAGIVEDPHQKVDPLWVPYVRVESASDIVGRAGALGARLVAQAEGAAILVDPTGAAFGVQEWEGRK